MAINRYSPIGRLDLILNSEGDTTNRYKLSKARGTLVRRAIEPWEAGHFEIMKTVVPEGYSPATDGLMPSRSSSTWTLSRWQSKEPPPRAACTSGLWS